MRQKKTFRADRPVSVLMPTELQQAIAARADEEERSFSGIVRRALKRQLGLEKQADESTAQ